ncbi:hypothetical protein BAUCODRAFT_71386 [Baudoinia panamericana UAMH 10762]|uniref:RNA polymerase II subunit A C-terminal domain phosphatase n=1 Tax=Baudoinia panamericana (strain UAMH 10762) TaxID=717646 RepID=M2MGX7_BAUPA|nr:uncharacterized protein BAUCODRAFT_71386 [Baudoinia panamericana UAMH 10762]EMC95886.1 hypothetical protein BAUCODRAFT_71386 [Baudoinia panamericana UAMH 10762]
MRLYTPAGLKYPIRVTKVLVGRDDDIETNSPLFRYSYTTVIEVNDPDTREYKKQETNFYAEFESEVEGKVTSINVKEKQIIKEPIAVAEIEEPCKHEVQFGGMCANCGKDMDETTYSTTVKNTERATINTVHGHTKLLVSHEEASRADDEAKRRLIKSRKLSLVVDLDQTIIHATVDPTVAEWQADETNPNHAAVKGVRKFQLVDDGPGGRGTWYYIKLRPGLSDFLQLVSQYYELHIYTMATRAYAEEIAKLVDPGRKLFANRILSRDENGSMNSKSLKRLFPVDTKMVVIIDDRGDVWSWSPNLVKVSAYDFFVGIGDINSSFLPKRPELEARPTNPVKAANKAIDGPTPDVGSDDTRDGDDISKSGDLDTPGSTPPVMNGKVSAVDRMVSMAGNCDEDSMKEKSDEQDETIAAQLADRPLLQKQKILDAAEEEAKTSPAVEAAAELLAGNGEEPELSPSVSHPKYRHNLLQDDDTELENLGRSLRDIHQAYFDDYDRDRAAVKGSRVAELRPDGPNRKRPLDDIENIPDAAAIMTSMKSRVLSGVHLVFSGVVPLGVNPLNHDLAIWARSFGANVQVKVSRRTTHLISSPDRRTAKVRQALKKGSRIAIVNQNWLYACFSQWKKVDEEPYRIHVEAAMSGKPGVDTDDDMQKYSPSTAREDSGALFDQSEEDWSEIRGELDDYLGSEGEESDAESVRTESTEAEAGGSGVNGTDENGQSRLQKRKKEALSRTTSLTNVVEAVVFDAVSSTSRPADDPGGQGSKEEVEEDDLEAALEAEMLKQADEGD